MIELIFLGIVQGLTEFLPISSSGHLVILEYFFGIKETLGITVALHFGTFLATMVFFIRPISDIIKGLIQLKPESIKIALHIILGNLPIVVFALIFKELVEQSFTSLNIVFIFLGLTGVILLLTKIVKTRKKKIGIKEVLIIGIGQMFALFPGLSRSGLTISFGIFTGVSPEDAFRFSFLLSLPAVLGANILEMRKVTSFGDPMALLIGVTFSFFSGLLALRLLRNTVQKNFFVFGFYCLLISIIFIIVGH